MLIFNALLLRQRGIREVVDFIPGIMCADHFWLDL